MSDLKFKTTKKLNDQEAAFNKAAWDEVDRDYYGKAADELDWVKRFQYITARLDGRVVGVLKYKYSAGVCHVAKLIVDKQTRGMGVGKQLMAECENQAKELNCHKVELTTREEWTAYKFYKDLGYEDTAVLKKHYHGLDYVLMSKLI